MKKIKLYLYENFKSFDQEWEDVEPFKIIEVDESIDLWSRAIAIDNKIFYICSCQNNNYKIRELEQFNVNGKHTFGENNIKCPICGYEDSNSWEFVDDDGEIECEACGTKFDWSREIEVSYSTQVQEAVYPIRLGTIND